MRPNPNTLQLSVRGRRRRGLESQKLSLLVALGLGFTLAFPLSLVQAREALGQSAPIKLLSWQPGPKHASWIIPVRAGESGIEAASQYLKAVRGDQDAQGLVPSHEFEKYSPKRGWKFKAISPGESARVTVIANREADHYAGEARIRTVEGILAMRTLAMQMVPVGATLRLNDGEREQFTRQLAQASQGMILLGGADLAPSLYGQDVSHAILFNEKYDLMEMALVQGYLKHGEGPIMGICRGSQMLAVAHGNTMLQDIPAFVQGALSHGRGEGGTPSFHPLIFQATEHNHFTRGIGITPSEFGQPSSVVANSTHHQAVVLKEGGELQVVAKASDGITEMFESRSGRVIGIQSHPENPDPSGLGPKVFDYFSNQVKQSTSTSCQSLLAEAS